MRHLVVVVPARDEEARIGNCLMAVERAVGHLGPRRARGHSASASPDISVPPDISVQVVVVLDSCTDDTARIVRGFPGVVSIEISTGRVGAARSAGVRRGLELTSHATDEVWIATTDADSRVPQDWLTVQLDAARVGADVFCGLVDPDAQECGPATYATWRAPYTRVDGHAHVHGANLGLRADAYLASGGFDRAAVAHEDVRLVEAARAQGFRVVSSAAAVVATSGRTVGRVGTAGFAGYLRSCLGPDALAPARVPAPALAVGGAT